MEMISGSNVHLKIHSTLSALTLEPEGGFHSSGFQLVELENK